MKGQGGQFAWEIDRMHDQYGKACYETFECIREAATNMPTGPIVRINPDELHVRDSMWVQVLNAGPASVRTVWTPASSYGKSNLSATETESISASREDAGNYRSGYVSKI